MEYPVIVVKRSVGERLRYRIAAWLISLSRDIGDQAFNDFAGDNDYEMKVHELIAELEKWPLYYEIILEGGCFEADSPDILCIEGYNGGARLRRK